MGFSKTCRALLAASLAFPASVLAQENAPLRLVETIPLPDVAGRIDHFGIDVEGRRLFMAALGNNTVEGFDLNAGKRIHTLRGLEEPQGIFYVAGSNRLFVAEGSTGACKIFDGTSLKLLRAVQFSDDADNVRYDAARKQIYVGYASGALAILDDATGDRLGDIRLDGHPESFRLESSGQRIFVNVPTAGHIAVVDRAKRAVIQKWPNGAARSNFPMALDESHRRLLVAYRRPAELAVFDTESGRRVASLPCAGDADDLWFDAARRRIYVSGGEGVLSVIAQRDADHYEPVARIPTASGARTSIFVPELNRLYLAVPRRVVQKAELRVYEVSQ